MKKFSNIRHTNDMINRAEAHNWNVNIKSSNNLTIDLWLSRKDVDYKVYINTENGKFGIMEHKDNECSVIATHNSDEFDNEDWYKEILDIIYS